MFDLPVVLALIPLFPLGASALIALLGYSVFRQYSHWPCILGAVGACVCSVILVVQVAQGAGADHPYVYYPWFQAGSADVGVTLRADALSAIMAVTVTFIGTFIVIYSAGYMHGDPGYPRFFAEVSFFLFSMCGLVLASNFFVLYACWEGVGVCSYLLIGFWFTRPAAAAAARKAFLVTRIGDVGLFIGILVLWSSFGHTVNFDEVFARATASGNEGLLTLICLLLFCGAVGKSGQFPLHVWLPDAMEGPTPVSALIHAATMVTAGVYLVARCMPLFAAAPDAQLVVACIGGFTAFLAALMALTQPDLKRVLAYSTISQLGYMFMGLGCGVKAENIAALAAIAAIFHLFTHAFFKALLFLSAGSVMHAMGGIIDMRRFGGLRRLLPTTHWTFLCGALALAAVPPFAGFWSKDEIFNVALLASGTGSVAPALYAFFFCLGIVTAGLTAFYTFRAYFLTFWGAERIPEEAGHHAHESSPVMLVPLMVLAVGAVLVGIVADPFTHWFSNFLESQWLERSLATRELLPPPHWSHGTNWPMVVGTLCFSLGGVGLAWWMYIKRPGMATQVADSMPAAYQLSRNRFYLDEIYSAFIVKPLEVLAMICRFFDQYLIDGVVDLVAQVPRFGGFLVRPIQNGLVQFYALVMALVVAGFLLAILLR
jgi:proton-translocating NADH-quinone oxidoreductase chain L